MQEFVTKRFLGSNFFYYSIKFYLVSSISLFVLLLIDLIKISKHEMPVQVLSLKCKNKLVL